MSRWRWRRSDEEDVSVAAPRAPWIPVEIEEKYDKMLVLGPQGPFEPVEIEEKS